MPPFFLTRHMYSYPYICILYIFMLKILRIFMKDVSVIGQKRRKHLTSIQVHYTFFPFNHCVCLLSKTKDRHIHLQIFVFLL